MLKLYDEGVIHEILAVGLLECNCSIFGDEETREAIVIDPGDDVSRIVQILERHQLKVKAIVITHGHIDHVMGANKLRELSGAPVYMNQRDADMLDALPLQASWLGVDTPERPPVDTDAVDGTTITLANARFHVMHTPGHTPGSSSVWIPEENKLVAGDTLFRDSVGRTDLPGGNSRRLLSSIKTRLYELPDETVVIPGHGANTTIGREKEHNPFVRG
ncbi:MAG TPA: MBL fold metallo-hydrolase [Bryobacteraceae bacterium]|jgi:glyoxylase-like metal-dependent hydrolase (beta-lactamase superfamily II)|nr:MBL fold metallo-hydrolase [Bryobacteraceae bacterium]